MAKPHGWRHAAAAAATTLCRQLGRGRGAHTPLAGARRGGNAGRCLASKPASALLWSPRRHPHSKLHSSSALSVSHQRTRPCSALIYLYVYHPDSKCLSLSLNSTTFTQQQGRKEGWINQCAITSTNKNWQEAVSHKHADIHTPKHVKIHMTDEKITPSENIPNGMLDTWNNKPVQDIWHFA